MMCPLPCDNGNTVAVGIRSGDLGYPQATGQRSALARFTNLLNGLIQLVY